MSTFTLKIIAIAAMVIDHAGYLFFPKLLFLRVIGRLTMPIMAFFAAEGFIKTHDRKKYLIRLFVFALISELPFYLTFKHGSNVIFTIFLGVLTLYVCDFLKEKYKSYEFLPLILLCIFSIIINSDWSYFGILLIYFFYKADKKPHKIFLYTLIVALISFGASALDAFLITGFRYFHYNLVQFGIILSFPLLYLYNGKQGPRMKYLFYIFYPLHLIVLFLTDTFLT